MADNNGDTDISALYSLVSGNALAVTTGKRLEIRQGGVLSLGGSLSTSYAHLSAYSGSLIQGSNNVTVSAQYTQSGGTFIGGSAAIRIGAASSLTAQFVLERGTFLSTTGTLSMGAHYTHTEGGTFSHNNGTVTYDAASVTWNVATSETFYNLTLDCAGSGTNCAGSALTVSSGDTLICENTLTLSDGQITTGTVEGQNAISISTLFDGGSGLLSITGSATRTVTLSASTALPAVTLNAANATITGPSSGDITMAGTLTLQAGAFTAPGGTLYISGNFTHTGGSFAHNNGTVNLRATGSPTMTVLYSNPFYNLHIDLAGTGDAVSSNYTISSGTPLVLNELYLIDGLVNGSLVEVKGNVTYGTILDGGTIAIKLTGTGTQVVESETSTTRPSGTFTIAKPAGTVTLSGALSLNTSGQDLTLTGGILDLNGNNITINDQFLIGTGTTLRLTGDETLSGGPDAFSRGSSIYYDAAGSTRRLKTFNNRNIQNLTVSSTGSAVFQLPVRGISMSGSLTISGGTLQVDGGQTLTLSGSWTRTSGTFTSGTGTVLFKNTSSQTLTDTSAFNNLIIDDGLIGHWKLDEGVGTVAADTSRHRQMEL
jgi:hypothetical protein